MDETNVQHGLGYGEPGHWEMDHVDILDLSQFIWYIAHVSALCDCQGMPSSEIFTMWQ